MRAKVHDDINATETHLHADSKALHVKMTSQLNGVLDELVASFQQLQNTEETDYNALMGNLSSWQAARDIENERQRAWLQRLKDTLQGSTAGIGGEIAELRAGLKAADRRLTARGVALEREQMSQVLLLCSIEAACDVFGAK